MQRLRLCMNMTRIITISRLKVRRAKWLNPDALIQDIGGDYKWDIDTLALIDLYNRSELNNKLIYDEPQDPSLKIKITSHKWVEVSHITFCILSDIFYIQGLKFMIGITDNAEMNIILLTMPSAWMFMVVAVDIHSSQLQYSPSVTTQFEGIIINLFLERMRIYGNNHI